MCAGCCACLDHSRCKENASINRVFQRAGLILGTSDPQERPNGR